VKRTRRRKALRRIFARTARTNRSSRRFHSRWTVNREKGKVRAYTRPSGHRKTFEYSIVTFSALAQNAYMVNTEGTQLQSGQIATGWKCSFQGKARRWTNIERATTTFDGVDARSADDKADSCGQPNVAKELAGPCEQRQPEQSQAWGPGDASGRAAAVFFPRSVWTSRPRAPGKKDISEGKHSRRKWANRSCRIFLSIVDASYGEKEVMRI